MNPVEIIRKKRDGAALSKKELEAFIGGYVTGSVDDYQMSALLMAIFFTGMTAEETAALTNVMLHSGKVLDLSSIPGLKVDKHSTGGVGDKVSLILAPMVAACGVPVPMISGRGLGHTGGTLDKLEAIPGFRTDLSIEEYKNVIRDVGLVMIGQTSDIAPADKKMYALRDVTATVESIPLIAGSIMSKKLAEGIDALVLDVKTGNGAFMREYNDSVALAKTLVGIGTTMGKTTIGFITEMSQPLGMMIGNWLEVVESVECLRGKNVPDLMEVTYVLGGAMVYAAGKSGSIEEGMKECQSAIWSGRAYDKFLEVVKRQGGDVSYIEQTTTYEQSSYKREVRSKAAGYVHSFETMRIGLLAVDLGAGRKRVGDAVDPKAGIVLLKKTGDKVENGEPLATIYTDHNDVVAHAEQELHSCIHLEAETPPRKSPVLAYVDNSGLRQWTPPEVY